MSICKHTCIFMHVLILHIDSVHATREISDASGPKTRRYILQGPELMNRTCLVLGFLILSYIRSKKE